MRLSRCFISCLFFLAALHFMPFFWLMFTFSATFVLSVVLMLDETYFSFDEFVTVQLIRSSFVVKFRVAKEHTCLHSEYLTGNSIASSKIRLAKACTSQLDHSHHSPQMRNFRSWPPYCNDDIIFFSQLLQVFLWHCPFSVKTSNKICINNHITRIIIIIIIQTSIINSTGKIKLSEHVWISFQEGIGTYCKIHIIFVHYFALLGRYLIIAFP